MASILRVGFTVKMVRLSAASRLQDISISKHGRFKKPPATFEKPFACSSRNFVTLPFITSSANESRLAQSDAVSSSSMHVPDANFVTHLPEVPAATGMPSTEVQTFASTDLPLQNAADVVPAKLDTSFLSDLAPAGEAAVEHVNNLHALGLGSYWTPVGWVQNGLELLHSTGLPWWATIALATFAARTLVFPLVIKGQRATARMSEVMPEMVRLQQEMREAQIRGDMYEYTVISQRFHKTMTAKGANPLVNMAPMLAQAPIFISFFIGLRKMANAPVDSMHEGGMLWFQDLAAADPYYILPILTAATLHMVVRVGADGNVQFNTNKILQYGMLYGLPVMVLGTTSWFPAAILVYWLTSNLFALLQVVVLKIPALRLYFDIPEKKPMPPSEVKLGPDGKKLPFKQQLRESMKTSVQAKDMYFRIQADEVRFRNAGFGPIPKTFKYDPTKARPVPGVAAVAGGGGGVSPVASQPKRS